MDNSVNPVSIVNTILSVIKAIASVISSGPVGIGLSIGLIVLLGIGFFTLKAQIMAFLRKLAANQTQDANNQANQDAERRAKEAEVELTSVTQLMAKLKQSQKKAMLDALTLEELKSYAKQAYGEDAVNRVVSLALTDLGARYNIYCLYGLESV